VASSRECADIVRQLISHGADPNSESEFGAPLHAASYNGSPEIARVLLENGANPNALEHPDYSDGAALHIASYNLNVGITIVEILLEYGANVDLRNEAGWTPLHEAAYNLNLQVLVVLLNRGADPHAKTNKGETPFQLTNAPYRWASKENQAQIIQLLSERTSERM
jgi:ankyrin repeat protein